MSRLLVLMFLSFATYSTAQKNSIKPAKQFKSLRWLEGAWERTNVKPGITATEEWNEVSPSELKGLGITMKGQDTMVLEKIQILLKNGNIYYVADVKENKAPVYFKFTSLTPDGFVCENPDHDFPKRIEYRLAGSTLTVLISDGTKSQNYLFTRL